MSDSGLFDLTDKVALVTGASRGLGKGMAVALAKVGVHLALNARSADSLQETAQEIRQLGRRAEIVPGDISDEAQVKTFVDAAQKAFGRIDILINNAGLWEGRFFLRLSKADWDKVVSVNLTGTFLVAKEVGRIMMKQRSGTIIQMASVQGIRGGPEAIVYGATKAGVIQMTQVMALEMAPFGVRVNAIAPGLFYSDMTKRYLEDREALRQYVKTIPLGRYGQPEDLTGAVLFLASAASGHVTGQTIVIDGGQGLF